MVLGLWPVILPNQRQLPNHVSLTRLSFCPLGLSHGCSRLCSWVHPKLWRYLHFSFQLKLWNKNKSFNLHHPFNPCVNCLRDIMVITFFRDRVVGGESIEVLHCALRSSNERLRVVTVNKIPKGYLPAMTPFEPACLSLVIWGLGRESWECFNGFCSTPEIDLEVAKRNACFLCSPLFLSTWWPLGEISGSPQGPEKWATGSSAALVDFDRRQCRSLVQTLIQGGLYIRQ